MEKKEGGEMENWKKDARRDVVMVDIDALVPTNHLLRKIKKVMDYDWLYERLDPYCNHETGRPGEDPVVIIKDGIARASLRDTILTTDPPANKKKYRKEQVKKVAKKYDEQLRQEVNAERERLGKKPIKLLWQRI